MKTKKFLTVLLVAILATTSCVQDDDYTIPTSLGAEENAALQALLNSGASAISITDLKAQFEPGEATQIVSDMYVKGYVSSSDATGNFYKEFFIQDSPSSPTAAMKVVLNQVDSYNQFNFGREVYIKLKDLYIGETRTGDDIITIGGVANTDNEVEALTGKQVPLHIFRSEVTENIEPQTVKFTEINDSHIGMFVMIENASFPESLKGESFVDPLDDFDTQRTLQSCDGFGYSTFPLETSSFANFSQQILPTELGGTISGIVAKTFNGSNLVLVLNDLSGVDFTQTKCQPLDINDFSVIFEEDFNTAVDNTNLDIPNWTNFAEEGSELWTEQVFSGNGYAEFSGFRTGDDVNIGWLISPGIDMDAQENEFLNFFTAQHHLDSDANTLEVMVSTNFNGTDVLSATWTPITANLATRTDSWYQFKDSGLIDISSYSGTLHVAFKVTGSGNDQQLDGAYHVEDFKILATK
ncbi:DUF5689 domain-containing protein [Gelatiniphilus marinus]|uniref:DUF5689 domain-containing protein n=1 Tax=Gelatiniphilus marinus TaxID=1759464 RepID=A0ABW5JUC7_9FLAO